MATEFLIFFALSQVLMKNHLLAVKIGFFYLMVKEVLLMQQQIFRREFNLITGLPLGM